jgi:hypothetical protein
VDKKKKEDGPVDKYSDKAYLESIKYQGGSKFYWPYNGFKITWFITGMLYWHIIMVVGPWG